MRTSRYTLLFALAVCVCCSTVLSITYLLLRDRQEQSRQLDRQKNILLAARLKAETEPQVEHVFASRVRPFVVDRRGVTIPDRVPDDLPKDSPLLPLYCILPADSDVSEGVDSSLRGFPKSRDAMNRVSTGSKQPPCVSYVYPVEGLGLWGPIHGYLAVSPDGREVVGVAFYEHDETPGLGGEISQSWFQDHFVGKLLYHGARLVGIEVVKGKARDHADFAKRGRHMVDGMSGATITGRGITDMMRGVPAKYEPFFMRRR
ncbi:MAG: NADH:ubiquinone reductase (Na(+)-transporting) subunit C [Myxococcota bacterium]